MKISILILISFLYCINPATATAQELYSHFSCEIKKQVILDMVDGEPKIYSSIQGGLKNGDSFNIIFNTNTYWLEMKLDGVEKNLYISDLNDTFEAKFPYRDFDSFYSKIFDIEYMNGHELKLSKNDISVHSDSVRFGMKRYHKDDWSGTFALSYSNHLIGFTCTMDGQYNDIIEKLRNACFEREECKNKYLERSNYSLGE